MTRRTRLFVAISAGILVVGLGTGLLASYMGIQNLTLIGGDGPAEFAYVPADARMLGYADVRAVMDSEVRRKLLEVNPGSEGAERFRERTGINLMEDVDAVLAAVTPEAADGQGPPLVLARGRFDQVRLEGFAREEGGVVEDYQGSRLITRDEFALAFVEPGIVALGRPAAVRRAIDTKRAGDANITSNDEVMRLVKQVDDGTVWGVARFDALAGMRIPNEVKDRLPAISWFSARGVVNGGIEGLLRAEARDDQAAQDLRQVVQGFVALARMQAGSGNPEVADFVNSLQITGQGRTVSLGFSVSASMIDTLSALRAGRRPSQAQPDAEPETPEQPDRRRPATPAL